LIQAAPGLAAPGPASRCRSQIPSATPSSVHVSSRPRSQVHGHGSVTGHVPPAVAPALVHDALRAANRPLHEPVRKRFATELNDDMRDVRVHAGELASASAEAVGAIAYTAGCHVVLGANLTEATGYTVLAHELAHIAQREAGLHRYESGEHARAGSTARKVTINGVTMDEGDLTALGDLYEKPG